jgi:hypothetical protein
MGIKMYLNDTCLISLNQSQVKLAIIESTKILSRILPRKVEVAVKTLPIYDHKEHSDAIYIPDLHPWYEQPLVVISFAITIMRCLVLCLLYFYRRSISGALAQCIPCPTTWMCEHKDNTQR